MLKTNIFRWNYSGLSSRHIFAGIRLEDERFVDSECTSCGEGSHRTNGTRPVV